MRQNVNTNGFGLGVAMIPNAQFVSIAELITTNGMLNRNYTRGGLYYHEKLL